MIKESLSLRLKRTFITKIRPVLSGSTKYISYNWLSYISTGLILLIFQNPGIAQDFADLERQVNSITVKIEGAIQGSGVLVEREGSRYTVLTAWHAISPNNAGEEMSIVTYDNRHHATSMGKAKRVGSLDLGVITFNSNDTYELAKLTTEQKTSRDQLILVAGYANTHANTLSLSAGSLIANTDIGIDQGYQMLYTNKTKAGMSGGPIMTLKKRLIGIHGRGELDHRKLQTSNKVLKTNINQGIPIKYYENFTANLPIKLTNKAPSTWDDYYALHQSTYNYNADGKPILKAGQLQTSIRFVDKMISLRPRNLIGYARKSALMDLYPNTPQNSKYLKESLKYITEYQSLTEEARDLIFNKNEYKKGLQKFDLAAEYLSSMAIESYYFRSYALMQLGEFQKSLEMAKKGIFFGDILKAGSKGVTGWRDRGGNSTANDLFIYAGLYTNIGDAYTKLKDYNAATKYYDFGIVSAETNSYLALNDPSTHKTLLSNLYMRRAALTVMSSRNVQVICYFYSKAIENGSNRLESMDRQCQY